MKRGEFLKLAVAAVPLPALMAACGRAAERSLSLFNWSNYIGKKTLPGFEAETGIKVQTDLFSDEEEMFAKLKTGVRGYDVIVVTDYMIPRFKALGMAAELPAGGLKNLDNLAPRFRKPPFDPELRHTVPYLWGTTGIAFNKAKLPKPPDSWRALWDPAYKGKMSMLDNARDALGAALLTLGLPTDSADPAHLKAARDFLVQQRPLLKHYTSATYIDELVAGELWLAQAWSGDTLQAAADNKDVDYAFPREGTFIYVDSMTIARGSAHMEEALAFVDYVLRPDVAADIANTVRFATPNGKAMDLLDPALRSDPRVFPTPEVEARLRFYSQLDEKGEQAWTKTWQEVKVA